jgi:hypothetical protein
MIQRVQIQMNNSDTIENMATDMERACDGDGDEPEPTVDGAADASPPDNDDPDEDSASPSDGCCACCSRRVAELESRLVSRRRAPL